MEGAPEGINQDALKADIEKDGDKIKVEDLRVWTITRGKNSVTARVQCNGNTKEIMDKAADVCSNYGITWTKIQVEDVTKLPKKESHGHGHGHDDHGHHH